MSLFYKTWSAIVIKVNSRTQYWAEHIAEYSCESFPINHSLLALASRSSCLRSTFALFPSRFLFYINPFQSSNWKTSHFRNHFIANNPMIQLYITLSLQVILQYPARIFKFVSLPDWQYLKFYCGNFFSELFQSWN